MRHLTLDGSFFPSIFVKIDHRNTKPVSPARMSAVRGPGQGSFVATGSWSASVPLGVARPYCPTGVAAHGWVRPPGSGPLQLPTPPLLLLTFPGKPGLGPTLLWALICGGGSQSVGAGQETFHPRLKIKAGMHAGGFGCRRWISCFFP